MTVTECCLKGQLHEGTPLGTWSKIGALEAYFTGDQSSSRAILLLHDAYGIQLRNTQLLADIYAKECSARVIAPDLFDGSPVPLDTASNAEVRKKFDLKKFNEINSRANKTEPLRQSARDILALPGVKQLAATGFCWGGTGLLLMSDMPVFTSIAIVHPGLLDVPADFERVSARTPTLFQCAEVDIWFPEDQIQTGKKVLDANGVHHTWIVYKDTEHGFATRGDAMKPGDAKGMLDCKTDGIAFINKHFK